jgi:hypothetical protein
LFAPETPIMQWSDALGKTHGRYSGRPRIVSLVPSITELLVALGLAEALVGRTGFCIHPRQLLRRVPKLGGTKGFDADKLRALEPTHVIVNIDENRREEVEALSDCVPHLIVTHPLEARDNLDLYRLLGGVFGREAAAEALCADFENAWQALRAATELLPREKVLYLIWREPWLGVARDTYISRMAGRRRLGYAAGRQPAALPGDRSAGAGARGGHCFPVQRTLPLSGKTPATAGHTTAGSALRPDRRRDGFLVRQPGDRRTGLSARLADPPWATLSAAGTANPREIDQNQAPPGRLGYTGELRLTRFRHVAPPKIPQLICPPAACRRSRRRSTTAPTRSISATATTPTRAILPA